MKFLLSDNKLYSCSVKKSAKAKHILLKREKTGELVLIVPKGSLISQKKLETFLFSSEEWIKKTQKPTLTPPESLSLQALEEEWKIEYPANGAERISLYPNEKIKTLIFNGVSSIEDIVKHLNRFILKKAKTFLPQRLAFCCAHYNFPSQEKYKVSFFKSRWGSYSSTQILSLNARLLYLPIHLVDYVIIHELCHIKKLNHSREFYALLQEKLPHYKILEKEFKSIELAPFIWL